MSEAATIKSITPRYITIGSYGYRGDLSDGTGGGDWTWLKGSMATGGIMGKQHCCGGGGDYLLTNIKMTLLYHIPSFHSYCQ